jgi:Tfp pilus assembly protein PilN
MVEMNLLPWRDLIRKKQKKDLCRFYGVILSCMIVFLFGSHFYLEQKIALNHQRYEARVSNLKRQTLIDDSDTHRLRQENVKHQRVLIDLFNQLIDESEKINFIEFSRKNKKISMAGYALSLDGVKQFMKRIIAVKNIDFVTLTSIKERDSGVEFELLAVER